MVGWAVKDDAVGRGVRIGKKHCEIREAGRKG